MGNHLNGLAQVIAPALFIDHFLIDSACGHVICLGSLDIQKTFVVPQIKICFSSIIGHIALTMFVRIEGTRIHVDIRIKLLYSHPVPPGLQEPAQRSRNNTFTQGRSYSSGYENILCTTQFDSDLISR